MVIKVFRAAAAFLPMVCAFDASGTSCTSSPARAAGLFHATRVALLLLGEAFRSGVGHLGVDVPCNASNAAAQEIASRSFVERVVLPLETLGATVRIIFTFPHCGDSAGASARHDKLLDSMLSWFGRERVAAYRTVRPMGLPSSWLAAYDLLESTGEAFDYVLRARHDLHIALPLPDWPVAFEQLLFEDKGIYCGGNCQGAGLPDAELERKLLHCRQRDERKWCAGDRMMWVPRRYLPLVLALHRSPSALFGHRFIEQVARNLSYAPHRADYAIPPQVAHLSKSALRDRCGTDDFDYYRIVREC